MVRASLVRACVLVVGGALASGSISVAAGNPAGGGGNPAATPGRSWPADEMPLPLAVHTPQDLAVKAVAERQYLIFNLLAGGKLAYDAGDFATAAAKWEALLRINPLDPEIGKTIR